MFTKYKPDPTSIVRAYELYSKHNQKWNSSIMINLKLVPKIAIDGNKILFFQDHTQVIEFETEVNAVSEFETIHSILNKL